MAVESACTLGRTWELTNGSPRCVPFGTFDLCPQVAQRYGELVVDLLDGQVEFFQFGSILRITIVHVHLDTVSLIPD